MIYFFSISALINTILGTLFGWFVYSRDKKRLLYKTFAIFCFFVVVWNCSYFIWLCVATKQAALFFIKLAMAGTLFIQVSFLHYVLVFLDQNKGIKRKIVITGYVIDCLLLPFCFTSLIVLDVTQKMVFKYWPEPGKLLWLFLVNFFVYLIFSTYILYREYRNSVGLKKAQLRISLWAIVIGDIGGLSTFPLWFNVNIPPYTHIFISFYVVLIAYAIVRHHLMDIEVIVKKTLVFAGLLASVFAILVLPTLLIQDYIFRAASTTGKLLGVALSGIIIILSLRRIENFLINITDKYLFQKRYDYKELLKTFTSEVLTVVDLDSLVNLTVDKLADIVKISSSAVLLLDQENQQFNVVASRNVKDSKVTLGKPDGIVTFLEQTHGYLLKKEFIEKKIYIPPSIQEIIDKLNAELIIPMVLHTDVMGILSLGKKKSDEDYTQDDLDILLPLARTLAIAISNARLFSELGRAQAEAAQREKMAVIGTLSAGINHEICNPLGIARGQCEAFLLNLKDGLYSNKTPDELLTKAKDIMTKVIKETDRATAITKRLSSFAKPAKGTAELVNIDKEIDDVLNLVGYELKLDKIEFDKQIEKGLPDVFVDKKQLQEVLFNLIRNAGQAIGEKGKIVVTAKQDEDRVFIDVKDTGSGIPSDKLKELFNPFFTTKEPGKGTGLGLFIVRQVVEKNGGKIYLKETKVGEGTTFTVEFPVTTGKESKVQHAKT